MRQFGWLMIGVCLLTVGLFAAQDFAPKVDLPAKMVNRDFWVEQMKSWKIPRAGEVPAPAYPGAIIIQLFAPGSIPLDGEAKSFPVMTMGSIDEMDKVLAFYKDKLKDWKYKDAFGIAHVFWQGPDNFNFMDVSQGAQTIHVVIMKAGDSDPLAERMPEMKTKVQINYRPNQ